MKKTIGQRYYQEKGRIYHWGSQDCPHCSRPVVMKVSEQQAIENIRDLIDSVNIDHKRIFTDLEPIIQETDQEVIDKNPNMRYNAINIQNVYISSKK